MTEKKTTTRKAPATPEPNNDLNNLVTLTAAFVSKGQNIPTAIESATYTLGVLNERTGK